MARHWTGDGEGLGAVPLPAQDWGCAPMPSHPDVSALPSTLAVQACRGCVCPEALSPAGGAAAAGGAAHGPHRLRVFPVTTDVQHTHFMSTLQHPCLPHMAPSCTALPLLLTPFPAAAVLLPQHLPPACLTHEQLPPALLSTTQTSANLHPAPNPSLNHATSHRFFTIVSPSLFPSLLLASMPAACIARLHPRAQCDPRAAFDPSNAPCTSQMNM